MNPYILLAAAILSEIFGSSMLKLSNGFQKVFASIGVVVGMGSSFYCLSLALKSIPLGTAYAIWAGVGTALTALVGVLFWKESFHVQKFFGMVLIIGGVVIIKLAG
ncbi:DMT family transporter [Desmospora activa]|uniref:Multidrug resistance protein EbrA n=1 Tax=Desmospora activa DSM 45169 TaxID=1121389 RepID=A0A2T4Z7B6_9BACL|nr:multidrug efflux SMR transporter [Desmospora activa]PTM57780.1 multidrug resistance protein EbrA [Desmospora activa DSM 45169]